MLRHSTSLLLSKLTEQITDAVISSSLPSITW